MWALFVPTSEVSGVQTDNCIVAATAIPAASDHRKLEFDIEPIINLHDHRKLEFDIESLGLLALLSVLRVDV